MSVQTDGEAPLLPELREGWLEAEQVRALFADLRACANAPSVQLKAGAEQRARSAPADLDAAEAALLDGRVRGVQIRYGYQGSHWCDTLVRTPRGVRLVRIRLEDVRPSAV